MRTIWFAALFLAAGATAATAQSLDGFLGGMLNGCQMSSEFEDFTQSLADEAAGSGMIRVPPRVKDAIGGADIQDREDHYLISVPVTATWKGLPLSGITYFLGKENGIYGWQVLFAATAEQVDATFGADEKRSRAILLKNDPMGAFSPDSVKIGKTSDGVPYFLCDLSN
ncbi:MAG: hypothetical protein C0606_17305 [Hyphomicrobiales bacterium]|nr:MAG: hypothetical protein C0606_17305 [Hyphomicrobiales bacterium]